MTSGGEAAKSCDQAAESCDQAAESCDPLLQKAPPPLNQNCNEYESPPLQGEVRKEVWLKGVWLDVLITN